MVPESLLGFVKFDILNFWANPSLQLVNVCSNMPLHYMQVKMYWAINIEWTWKLTGRALYSTILVLLAFQTVCADHISWFGYSMGIWRVFILSYLFLPNVRSDSSGSLSLNHRGNGVLKTSLPKTTSWYLSPLHLTVLDTLRNCSECFCWSWWSYSSSSNQSGQLVWYRMWHFEGERPSTYTGSTA